MPLYGSPTPLLGYGFGQYGLADLTTLPAGAGCSPILPAPDGSFWQLGINDQGLLTTTAVFIPLAHIAGPIMQAGSKVFQLGATPQGQITDTLIQPQTIQQPLPYIPLVSPGGLFFKMTLDPQQGLLVTTSTGATLLPDVIPYIPDVSMSVWPQSTPLICFTCGNATVTASADLSLWCCTCNTFVPPADTNILVVLDE